MKLMKNWVAAVILSAAGAGAAVIAFVSLKKVSVVQNPPPPGPGPSPSPGPTPPPVTPGPAPVGTRTAEIVVLAQNGNHKTFWITQQDLDTLTNVIPSTGYISNINYVDLQAINSSFDVISWVNANVIIPPTIPNLKFDLVAPDGVTRMNGVILTQDDWTAFRAQFPTQIGVYNVSQSTTAANNTPAGLAQFIIAHPKIV